MSDFKVGDRVKCVDDHDASKLLVGKTYTVAEVLSATVVLEGSGPNTWYKNRFVLAEADAKAPTDGIRPNYYRVKLEDGTEVECREVMKALGLYENFDLGSAFKYLWRAGKKHADIAEDLEKAATLIKLAAADLKKAKS